MVSLSGELPTQAVSAQAEVPADAARQDDVEITVDDEDGEAKNKAETTGQTAEQTAKTEESPTAKAEGDQDLEADPSAKATETKTEETEPTAGQSKGRPCRDHQRYGCPLVLACRGRGCRRRSRWRTHLQPGHGGLAHPQRH